MVSSSVVRPGSAGQAAQQDSLVTSRLKDWAASRSASDMVEVRRPGARQLGHGDPYPAVARHPGPDQFGLGEAGRRDRRAGECDTGQGGVIHLPFGMKKSVAGGDGTLGGGGADVRRAARGVPGRPDPRVAGPLPRVGDDLAAAAGPHADGGQVQARADGTAAGRDQDLPARQLPLPARCRLQEYRTGAAVSPHASDGRYVRPGWRSPSVRSAGSSPAHASMVRPQTAASSWQACDDRSCLTCRAGQARDGFWKVAARSLAVGVVDNLARERRSGRAGPGGAAGGAGVGVVAPAP